MKRLRFLEDNFGFKVIKIERESYGVFIILQNQTTSVRISFEPREGGIFILLSRLVNGKTPMYPIFVEPDTELHSFYLDDLIHLKDPKFEFSFRIQRTLSPVQLELALGEIADALQKYASSVLMGDFEVFTNLEHVVKMRRLSLKKQS